MTWRNPTDRADIEQALNAGQLFVAMGKNSAEQPIYWQLRRNGRTQTWKREPNRFYIPVKYGYRGYATIDESYPLKLLRIAESRREAETP
jgi:hypothetical protein